MSTRPRVSVYLATTLDGCIARDDGRVDYLDRFQGAGGEDYGYAEFIGGVDAVVLGRATWEVMLGFGVGPKPFGERRVVVLTHRPLEAGTLAETHAGELRPLLERLGADGVRHVYLDGGATIRQGLREGVVDALTLSVVPLVLGGGRPLFERGLPGSGWTLRDARGFPSGLARLRYERARD